VRSDDLANDIRQGDRPGANEGVSEPGQPAALVLGRCRGDPSFDQVEEAVDHRRFGWPLSSDDPAAAEILEMCD
jgi:hypothetical protein